MLDAIHCAYFVSNIEIRKNSLYILSIDSCESAKGRRKTRELCEIKIDKSFVAISFKFNFIVRRFFLRFVCLVERDTPTEFDLSFIFFFSIFSAFTVQCQANIRKSTNGLKTRVCSRPNSIFLSLSLLSSLLPLFGYLRFVIVGVHTLLAVLLSFWFALRCGTALLNRN